MLTATPPRPPRRPRIVSNNCTRSSGTLSSVHVNNFLFIGQVKIPRSSERRSTSHTASHAVKLIFSVLFVALYERKLLVPSRKAHFAPSKRFLPPSVYPQTSSAGIGHQTPKEPLKLCDSVNFQGSCRTQRAAAARCPLSWTSGQEVLTEPTTSCIYS